jgi:hypothetical protein
MEAGKGVCLDAYKYVFIWKTKWLLTVLNIWEKERAQCLNTKAFCRTGKFVPPPLFSLPTTFNAWKIIKTASYRDSPEKVLQPVEVLIYT